MGDIRESYSLPLVCTRDYDFSNDGPSPWSIVDAAGKKWGSIWNEDHALLICDAVNRLIENGPT